MAHGSVPLAGTPQKLDLAEGAPHRIQNLGDGPMYVQAVTGNTAPTDLDAARFVIPPKGSLVLTAHAGESTFAWGHHGGLVGHSQTPGAGAVVASAFYDQTYTIETWVQTFGNLRRVGIRRRTFTAGGRNYQWNVSESTGNNYFISVLLDRTGPARTIWVVIYLSGVKVSSAEHTDTLAQDEVDIGRALTVGETITLQLWPSEPPAA